MAKVKQQKAEEPEWVLLPDELDWDDVGGRLLANIARGMYSPQGVLREYVQIRLDVTGHTPTMTEIAAVIARSNAINEALWQQASAVAAKDNAMVPTGLFIQSLNEMIDNHEKRIIAAFNRVPNLVLMTLYFIAALASGFTGYSRGLKSRQSRLPAYLAGVLVAAVILLIQDIDLPLAGLIGVSQQPMIDVAASLASYPE